MTIVPPDHGEKPSFQLTRELELLISAALVFALLQLPDALDEWWARTVIHVGGSAYGTAFVMYYIGKLLSYGLIAAILVHFLLRGFWVAVMGLRSVYPEGINRDKLDQGPILQEFYRDRLFTLSQLETRVDRIAASIFSFVFLFLILFLMLTAWAGIAWALALLAGRLFKNERVTMPLFIIVFFGVAMATSMVAWLDRIAKKRALPPAVHSASLRTMRFVHYATLNFLYAPVFLTFATQTSRRRTNAILVGFMYAMVAIFMVSVFTASGVIGFDSFTYYPAQSRPHQLRAVHYDDLRPADMLVSEPTIQAEVIQDPYIRLFVPYDAREDNERMRILCPDVAPLRGEGFFVAQRGNLPDARIAQLSSCFDRIYNVALDGQRIDKANFIFYRHPVGRVAGRLALIPASSLAPGRHILTVKHVPLPGPKPDEKADEFYIPFWR